MRDSQFAEDARALVRSAQERARLVQHPGIGTEDLLYAVADSPAPVGAVARAFGLTPAGVAEQTDRLLSPSRRLFTGLDADALAAIGIDLDAVRAAVEAIHGPVPLMPPRARPRRRRPRGHLPVTGRAKSCLDAAVREAGRDGAPQVAAHHLGAVVVGADGGLVPPIMAALGIHAPRLRRAILETAP